MKKFLSIKNSNGIYVARASFSSDETVIDFVNKENETCIGISDNGNSNNIESSCSPEVEPIPSTSNSCEKKKNKNPVNKVLKVLHLKSKNTAKMDEKNKSSTASLATGSMQSLKVPKSPRSRSRTAEMVRKFSVNKKSSIPVKSESSVDSSISDNESKLLTISTALKPKRSLTISDMNLVNIDYRQENISSEDDINVDVQVARSQYRSYRSDSVSKVTTIRKTFEERAADNEKKANLARSSEQLQIKITGSSRCKSANELPHRNVRPNELEIDQRRPQTTKKLNICRGVTLSTIALLPASKTQAQLSPTYQISTNNVLKNESGGCKDSHRETVMSLKPIATEASTSTSFKVKPLVVSTGRFDTEEIEKMAHSMTSDERRNSLMLELIEAESHESDKCERENNQITQNKMFLDEERVKTIDKLEKQQLPIVIIDKPSSDENKKCEKDINSDKNDSTKPTIQFEVGKKVRPIITSNLILYENLRSVENEPTATFNSITLQKDRLIAETTDTDSFVNTNLISVDSSVASCSGILPSPLCNADTNTEQSDQQTNNRVRSKNYRRRIAYIAQEPSEEIFSHSGLNSLDDSYCSDQFHLDSSLTQLTYLSSSNIEIKELLMPAYGDLVWDEDGVNKTIVHFII